MYVLRQAFVLRSETLCLVRIEKERRYYHAESDFVVRSQYEGRVK